MGEHENSPMKRFSLPLQVVDQYGVYVIRDSGRRAIGGFWYDRRATASGNLQRDEARTVAEQVAQFLTSAVRNAQE